MVIQTIILSSCGLFDYKEDDFHANFRSTHYKDRLTTIAVALWPVNKFHT